MNDQRKAKFLAISAALIWSTVATAFKVTLTGTDFINLLFFSSLTATISLFVILLIYRKTSSLKAVNIKDLPLSIISGLLNPFLYYLVLFKAYSLIPAQEAQPLNYSWPIILTILSVIILKQKVRIIDIVSILLGFIGVILITTHGKISGIHFSDIKGSALAFGSAFIWSAYWVLSLKRGKDIIIQLFLNFLFGTIYISIFILAFADLVIPDIKTLSGCIYIGLFEMAITFLIWNYALKLSNKTVSVSNIIYLVPFLSLVFIHYIAGEKIEISSVYGLVLIISGIVIQRLKSSGSNN